MRLGKPAWTFTPPKTNMEPENISGKGETSTITNHQFLGSMVVSRGV